MATRNRDQRTELHRAANEGDAAAVKALLAAGHDPNSQDSQGWSPLHFGAQASSAAVVETLLAAGARVDPCDLNGNTPLLRAVFNSQGDGSVIFLLRAAGADPLVENCSGMSPVSLARSIANYDVRQFFVDIAEG